MLKKIYICNECVYVLVEEIDKEYFLNISEVEVSRIILTIGGTHCFLEKRKLWMDSIKEVRIRFLSSVELK